MSAFGVQPRKRDWQPRNDGRLGWSSTDGHEITYKAEPAAHFLLDNEHELRYDLRDGVIAEANKLLDNAASWAECPNCGHEPHDGARCSGTADDGANPCACSWPDPGNYTLDKHES